MKSSILQDILLCRTFTRLHSIISLKIELRRSFTILRQGYRVCHDVNTLLNNDTNTGSSKKNAGIIKTYHSKTVDHIEMIQVLKCSERTLSFGYAQLMVGSERHWAALVGWPVDTACAQRRDWEGWTNLLASQKPRSYPSGLFWVGGDVRNMVYGEKIRDHRHLWGRITAAIAMVTPDMIQRTWHEIKYCLDICRATNGAHIETY
jgi:hypothetical protein